MANIIQTLLQRHGPMRGAALVALMNDTGLSSDAARQRLSRAKPPIFKFPVRLLPRNEGFYYLEHQRNTEVFWANFLRDLRESGSIFALAIDGLRARGNIVESDQFAVISGAPAIPMKKQLNVQHVLDALLNAGFVNQQRLDNDVSYVRLTGSYSFDRHQSVAELILLDAVREWARRLGFASYNSIVIRGEDQLQPIGPFMFDLAGPSWFAPLQRGQGNPGFLVADVFSTGTLDESHIKYFIRKTSMLRAMESDIRIMPMLIAESFTGPALTAGHAAGISLATPATLFGRRAGAAIVSLTQTLKNVAAYASADSPDRIERLINDLSDIEGRSLNLRGVLFELMCAYLVRRDAVSIDMGVSAYHPETGDKADIDILKITSHLESITCIECKGKEPRGIVDQEAAEKWLKKVAIMRAWLATVPNYREAKHRFELWTSGTFSDGALELLNKEKSKRVKSPIDWKDGDAVLELAVAGKEKAMADAFKQHYMHHPFAKMAMSVESADATSSPIVSTSDILNMMGPSAFGSNTA